MSDFMRPFVYRGDFYLVETNIGTEFIPGDLVSLDIAIDETIDDDDMRYAEICKTLCDYLEGNCIDSIEHSIGYYGRYSAPGYMDATDYTWGDTETAVMETLTEYYGID